MTRETNVQRDEALALLLADLTDQANDGQHVDIHAVCEEHPDLADELRELWGAVMIADAAGSSEATSDSTAQEAPALSFDLPCRFGDYELQEEVGRGGMGVVYRARQLSLNREVALKMILRGQFASDADRERFQAEAEAVARLDHPGIVPVFEVGEIDGQPYFSMKYVKGQTLSQLLAGGLMAEKAAAELIVAVARSIHYAHRQGVLHRDLKPSNIMTDVQGKPHVTDFGLAKRVQEAESLTRTGAILGTPAYMAPEQAAGARGAVGPGSDIFSLGTVLYHMLTGRPPFQAASPVDTVLLLLEQDVVPPRVVNPRVDRDLEMIALKCLQKPIDLRYDTAARLADDLEAYLRDEPIAARSGRIGQVMARMFRETHHSVVLENWGLLWMWHSLALFTACATTNALQWFGVDRWYYIALWTLGIWIWGGVFWWLRRRMGPVTFVERQIAHVWASSMAAIAGLFLVEILLDQPPLSLSPVLPLIAGMVFVVKAGILTGTFYIQAAALFATCPLMALFPEVGHLIFGVVSAACFFIPGLKYYRQRVAAEAN
ncbi:MAG: protein kinase [Planctomycetaceae bacterium]|nr:protein kinase [Planctomycetaceae bacterium]